MNKKLWRKDFFLPKNVLRYCIDVIKVTLGGYLKYAQIVCAQLGIQFIKVDVCIHIKKFQMFQVCNLLRCKT